MKKVFFLVLGVLVITLYSPIVFSEENGDMSGMAQDEQMADDEAMVQEESAPVSDKAEPAAEDIRQAQRDYVAEMSEETGTFDVFDSDTNKTRRLEIVRVHDRVGKTGDYYYTCADFKDVDSGEALDLDLDVEADEDGSLSIVDVRIHKVNGVERYTYDENDNRIPISG